MTLNRRTRAAVIALGVCAILVWQLTLFRNWAAIDAAYHQAYRFGALGTQAEVKFVYFLYYLNLFPIASTRSGIDGGFRERPGMRPEKDTLDYSLAGARQLIERDGATLVTAWGGTIRDGLLLQTYLYLPDAWRFGSPERVEMRTTNSAIFALGLAALFASFAWWGLPLVGALLVLFIGSNPFQLYEVYARNNIFGWVIITFCWVLALTVPFMIERKARGRVYWSAAILTGLFCGTVAHIRTEPLAILAGVGFVYLTSRVLTSKGRLLSLSLLLAGFLISVTAWEAYFEHKIREANTILAKVGGHIYPGPRLSFHTAWDIVWMGLADFDRKYGYEFKHQTSYEYAGPILLQKYGERLPPWPPTEHYDEARMYFRRPLDSPRYFEVLRDKVLHDISHDPLWYATILGRRVWRILNETTPIQLQFGNLAIPIPFHGALAVPLLAMWLVRRNWFAIQLLALGATTASTGLVLYSGRNWICFAIFHICAAATILAAIVQTALDPARRQALGAYVWRSKRVGQEPT